MKLRVLIIFLLVGAIGPLGVALETVYFKTTRSATVELYEGGKVVGTTVIPPNTALVGVALPDGNFMVKYPGRNLQGRVLSEDTDKVRPGADFARLETKSGEVYLEVFVIQRNAAEITIRHADGRATLPIETLAPEVQQALKYDPQAAADYLKRKKDTLSRPVAVATPRPQPTEKPQAKAATPAPEEPPPENSKPSDEAGIIASKIWNSLISRRATRIYKAILNPKNADSKSLNYGLGASPGDLLAEIPPGFLVLGTRNHDPVGGVVELPQPIGENRFAYVYRSDFAQIGAAGWRKWWDDEAVNPTMIPYPWCTSLTEFQSNPQTELQDVFENHVIASNRSGAFLKVWKLKTGKPTKGKPTKETSFGLVKTPLGWLFGTLAERKQTPVPSLNVAWEQIITPTEHPWYLKMEKSLDLTKGTALFKLADFVTSHRNISPRTTPQQVQILPGHYGTLLQFGLPGVLADLADSASADTQKIRISDPLPPSGSLSVEKQVIAKELALKFIEWSSERTLLEITATQDEREIERNISEKGGVNVDAKPWKTVKASDMLWITNDPDGGLRLTDGCRIYEITRVGALKKLKLQIYTVTENGTWKVKAKQ